MPPGNTSSGATPTTDIATFNSASTTTMITIDSGRTVFGLAFDLAAANYTIGATAGNPLYLSSGSGIQILSTLTATNALETINAPLILAGAGATSSFLNNSANGTGAGTGTLNFGGQISGGTAGAAALTLGGSNTNANTISGNIVNGSSTSLGLTKSGAGAWVLSGANTYSGATAVNAGMLQFNGASAMSGNSALTLASGSTVALRSDSAATFTPASITLPASGNATLNFAVNNVSSGSNNTLTLTGALSFADHTANTINVTGGNGYTLALGNISVPSSSGSSATNTLAINATSANVTTGTITVGSFGEGVTFGGNQAITVDHINANSNGSSLLTIGNGSNTPTVTVSNAATSVSRAAGTFDVVVNSGATLISNSNLAFNLGSSATPTLTINGAGRTILNYTAGDSYTSTTSAANVILNGGTLTNYNNLDTISTLTVNSGGGTLQGTYANLSGNRRSLNISNLNGTGDLTVGYSGLGSTSANAGSLVRFTGGGNYSGTVTVNPSTAPLGSYAIVDATTAVANATFNVAGDNLVGAQFYSNVGGSVLTFNTNNVTIGALAGSGTVYLNSVSSSSTATALTVGGNNATTTYSGSLKSLGSLTKTGTGTLTLSGANTYTGSTKVSQGTLLVSGSLSSASNSVTVLGGTLAGSGTVAGTVAVGATSAGSIAPSSATSAASGSIGMLTTGALTLNSNATSLFDLNGTATKGTSYDNLTSTGALTYGGTLAVALNAGYAPAGTTVYDLFDFTSQSGTFATLTPVNGYSESFNYATGELTLTAVPEPPTWSGALVLMALLGYARRKDLRALATALK